jgi:hypothetical protein
MSLAPSKPKTRKSSKLSSKEILAADVYPALAQDERPADRAVERIVAGLKAAGRTGKFPNVY